jgi:hypothetical protein
MLLSVSVAYGGLRWSGIDPEVSLDGQTLNVTAQWHSEDLCSVDGDVLINIYVPFDTVVSPIIESSADCNVNGEDVTLQTITELIETDSKKVTVTGLVTSGESMPARLLLDINGKHIRTCGGQANSLITCGSFKLK